VLQPVPQTNPLAGQLDRVASRALLPLLQSRGHARDGAPTRRSGRNLNSCFEADAAKWPPVKPATRPIPRTYGGTNAVVALRSRQRGCMIAICRAISAPRHGRVPRRDRMLAGGFAADDLRQSRLRALRQPRWTAPIKASQCRHRGPLRYPTIGALMPNRVPAGAGRECLFSLHTRSCELT